MPGVGNGVNNEKHSSETSCFPADCNDAEEGRQGKESVSDRRSAARSILSFRLKEEEQ